MRALEAANQIGEELRAWASSTASGGGSGNNGTGRLGHTPSQTAHPLGRAEQALLLLQHNGKGKVDGDGKGEGNVGNGGSGGQSEYLEDEAFKPS